MPGMIISHHLALAADEVFDGYVELDKSYFGGRRKGRRGRSTAREVVVFDILKRHDKVYTVAVDNAKFDTLIPVIKQKIMVASIVYTGRLSPPPPTSGTPPNSGKKYVPESPSAYSIMPNSSPTPNGRKKRSAAPLSVRWPKPG